VHFVFALLVLQAPHLDRTEQRIRAGINAAREEQITYLQRVVDIPSSTLNFEGVKKVGAVFRAALDSLGFTTRTGVLEQLTPDPDEASRLRLQHEF